MRRPEIIARQGGMPSGLLGRIVAPIMQRETAAVNRRAVALLDPEPGENILDVGSGNGLALRHIATLIGDGLVVGVDHSPVMCRRAFRNNIQAIRDGRVRVERGESDNLPFDTGFFDAAVCVHTLYFWNPPEPHLLDIARVIRPGGRFVLAFRPGSDPATSDFPASVYTFRSQDGVQALLKSCGFQDIHFETGADSVILSRARRGDIRPFSTLCRSPALAKPGRYP